MNDSPSLVPAHLNPNWILVVDDDHVMLGLIEIVLKAQGWRIETAASADAALAKVTTAPTPPAVLVCDVIMSGVDGLELTRKLRARVPGLKAIVVSAHLDEVSYWPEDLRDCPFLNKPFHNDELIQAVKAALAP